MPARLLFQREVSLEQWQATGAKFLVPYQLGLLCEAQAAVGRHEAALGTVEEALELVKRTGERWLEPELLRLAGELRGGIALRARGEPGGCEAGAPPSPVSVGPWRSLAGRALAR